MAFSTATGVVNPDDRAALVQMFDQGQSGCVTQVVGVALKSKPEKTYCGTAQNLEVALQFIDHVQALPLIDVNSRFDNRHRIIVTLGGG